MMLKEQCVNCDSPAYHVIVSCLVYQWW